MRAHRQGAGDRRFDVGAQSRARGDGSEPGSDPRRDYGKREAVTLAGRTGTRRGGKMFALYPGRKQVANITRSVKLGLAQHNPLFGAPFRKISNTVPNMIDARAVIEYRVFQ